ncbi:MAG: mRNA surveillance protein pelota [Candidatus Woesearchaeota archaeon]
MRIKTIDNRTREVSIEFADDLYHLYKVIKSGDHISGMTTRKIKPTTDTTQRSSAAIKKTLWLEICVQKCEFDPDFGLRVLGTITQGPPDVPKGEHHSFVLTTKMTLTIKKEWKSFELERLEQATKTFEALIILFDNQQAIIGNYTQQGFTKLTQLQNDQSKHAQQQTETKEFFEHILSFVKQKKAQHIIFAGPDFWKSQILELCNKESIRAQHVSLSDNSSFSALLKNVAFENIIQEDMQSKITADFEKALKHLATDNLTTYGLEQCLEAAQMGNIQTLFVSDALLQTKTEQIEPIIELAEQSKATVFIVETEYQIHKQLESLGGLVAILRFLPG